MRRLLLVGDARSPTDATETYITYTVPLLEAYASAHSVGYEFVQYKGGVRGRHVEWNRIPLLSRYIDTYDEILWLDATVLVTNTALNLFDVLGAAASAQIVAAKCADGTANPGVCLYRCVTAAQKSAIKDLLELWWSRATAKEATEAPWTHPAFQTLPGLASIGLPDGALHHMRSSGCDRMYIAKAAFQKTVLPKKCEKILAILVPAATDLSAYERNRLLQLRMAAEAAGHTVQYLSYSSDWVGKPVWEDTEYVCGHAAAIATAPDRYCGVVYAMHKIQPDRLEAIGTFGLQRIAYAEQGRAYALQDFSQSRCICDTCWVPQTLFASMGSAIQTLRPDMHLIAIPELWIPCLTGGPAAQPLAADASTTGDGPVQYVCLDGGVAAHQMTLLALEKQNLAAPETVHAVYVFGATEAAFKEVEHLTLFQQKKLRLYVSMPLVDVLKFFAESKTRSVFVSYTNAETQLAVLRSAHALVHSAPHLSGVAGYYVANPGTALQAVHTALQAAARATPAELRAATQALIERMDPYALPTMDAFRGCMDCAAWRERMLVAQCNTPIVLTYDNAPDEYSEYYFKTLKKHNWAYMHVGKGMEWAGWRGRAATYLTALQTMHPERVVVVTDARDVLCLRDSRAFLDAFASMKANMIVSTELFCHGRADVTEPLGNCVPLTEYWKHHTAPTNGKVYVNAGLICGKARALCEYYAWFLKSAYTDDQIALGHYMNTVGRDSVHCDTEARLLHTSVSFFYGFLYRSQRQAADAPTLADLAGAGVFFLHMPNNRDSAGQKLMYASLRRILDEDILQIGELRKAYPAPYIAWDSRMNLSE